MVTGMGIADLGLSYAGSSAGAVGFFWGGGKTQLSFWENRSRKGKERWGSKPVNVKRG